jgi:hypothetical protein
VSADAGAYFTATSTNFGGPRPGVLLIDRDEVRWTPDAGALYPNRTRS